MITRRRFLGTASGLAAAGLGLEGLRWGPRRLETSSFVIGTPSPAAASLRLACITDLHLRRVAGFEAEVGAAVAAIEPDALCLVGDIVDSTAGLEMLDDFLALLPAGVPAFATLGNWEYWGGVDLGRLRRTYSRRSIHLLVNEWGDLGSGIRLLGVDDYVGGAPAVTAPSEGNSALLLSHCPGLRDEAVPAMDGFSAMISGHTHGGQVRIGGWSPVTPPGSGDYVSGHYRGDGVDLLVSRGIGTSLIPIRLGSRPEVMNILWHTPP